MAAGLQSKIHVLKAYFGMQPNQTLTQFAAEVKALTEDEKLDLARGAAKNLKLTQADCDFPLQ